MQLQIAKRTQARIKAGLQGPSGSGKTYSALLMAYGLCNSWNKIAVIDTENYSASLYAHLGNYSVVNIAAPFSPEKYIEAIQLCEASGIEVIIIDSISHEWEGSGGILDVHGSMMGNSFTNWSKVTPRHNAFVQAMLQSPCHIIGTIRSKQDYVLSEKNGKLVPEKVGLKGVTRDGMDYEFTLVFDININHNAVASKDRTGLFGNRAEFKISVETGTQILRWCNTGEAVNTATADDTIDISKRISNCKTLAELLSLYKDNPPYQQSHAAKFSAKRSEFPSVQNIPSPIKTPAHGITAPTG